MFDISKLQTFVFSFNFKQYRYFLQARSTVHWRICFIFIFQIASHTWNKDICDSVNLTLQKKEPTTKSYNLFFNSTFITIVLFCFGLFFRFKIEYTDLTTSVNKRHNELLGLKASTMTSEKYVLAIVL